MLNDLLVTRFPNGVTNNAPNNIFASLAMLDPTKFHIFNEDFDYYNAANWTVTETQAGATQALTDGNGGLLLLTNSAADDDLNAMQKVGESYLLALGKRTFFKGRLTVSDATQSDFVIGLQITDVTPLAVTDGVYFRKDDGDTDLDFLAIKDSVAVSALAVATVTSAVALDVAFFWDGVDRIYYAVNGTTLGSITPAASLPDDEALTISFAVQNGEAVAKTLTIDQVFVAQER